ncbi:hypothetical protein Kpol_1023p30 [Vanderwaltozyma polyspora DSM 70294]|uniref:RNA helicase n=1 Tax=Vanderwaltozyma polyspora (strain ATCC 22028 / DSM 70294 / BCRC 21397 / CBS 2163 / NBRC 10782 / NRRL Y-8283 / UCD 57-17) TaxID=436907 RepID=A7TFQ3_VANPO|nr:uncharacterized protein Kpol_1023p30 [Vanderwaltozyma polyspora DSM 70294]EDO18861.1 hypothetical protein Kpol_1023p30 [Vanderwaltozyma polyspora DSM 70294]
MGTYRKRFNEKARAGHMSRLKELKRIRNKQFYRHEEENGEDEDEDKKVVEDDTGDSNAEILQPLTKEEKEMKKRKLEELFTPKESKVSRLKKKRLDKFIDHQLRREEKKTIIEKLQDYKIDTSLLTSSKRLGHGRQTKKEEFAEALSLERQGRGNDQTKEILYEEHEVKEWEDASQNEGEEENEDDESDFESKFGDANGQSTSSFVDRRPAAMGGSGGFGFGFSNVKVVNSTRPKPKRKFNWRERVEAEERRKNGVEDANDFESSSEDESDIYSGDSDNISEDDVISGDVIEAEESDSSILESGEEVEIDENEDEDSSENNESEEDSNDINAKFNHSKEAESFKEWANQEIKRIEGRDVEIQMPELNIDYQPIVREEDLDDGLQETELNVDESLDRKSFFVQVKRPEEIQAVRMSLPVFGEEHKIMEAIHHNDVVIICGETGSGKTTQVPQFLYEAGYGSPDSPDNPGMIGITQPRRVAAVSMANRVAQELGDHGNNVAYHIRFDSSVKDNTRVKFMTDGVLLREMMHDFKLTKYSAIIIDEAHERNINTDILIGMLSRCIKLRASENSKDPTKFKKLKLIIMSATLRVSDFSENSTLFAVPPPVLNVAARQFPVAVHFNRRTPYDYLEEAFKKTCKIHRRLPSGAILIFLTGQQEITQLVKRLRNEFQNKKGKKVYNSNSDLTTNIKVNAKNSVVETEEIDFSVEERPTKFDDGLDSANDDFEEDSEEEEGFDEILEEGQTENDPLYVLPLYSLLPTKEQMKVFQKPPKGSRLCIVATNVAETSLTIPGVRYVVDCGRSKERKYNESNGVQSFEIEWVSKASADQRSGRAGRTGPGHCYRLFSSAVYERDFDQFSKPEILRMPVESVVLQMKSMAIHNVVNFPFPTPPDRISLSKSMKLLQYLGALDKKEAITDDGKKMSLFPLSPRFTKILIVSNEFNCLPYIVTIVSALSVGNPFINEHELGIAEVNNTEETEENNNSYSREDLEEKKRKRSKFFKSRSKFSKLDKYSDVFKLMSVVSAMDYIPQDQRDRFFDSNFLRGKLINEIMKLRKQLMYIIKSNISKEGIAVAVNDEDLKSDIPNETQIKLLKQMVAAGFIDNVAIRADFLYPEEYKVTNKTSIINIPYIPVFAQKSNDISESFVYIHPGSILTNCGELPPKYIVFHGLHLSSNNKKRMDALCDIKDTPLANIARKSSLLTYGKPLTGHGLKIVSISPTERYCYVVPRFGSTVDSDLKIGWDLNPVAVHQVKEQGQWNVTKFVTNKNYKKLEASQKK